MDRPLPTAPPRPGADCIAVAADTSGLDDDARVLAVAAVAVRARRPVARLELRIDPGVETRNRGWPEAEAVNGIAPEDVAGAAPFASAWLALLAWRAAAGPDLRPVGHPGEFVHAVLRLELVRHRFSTETQPWADIAAWTCTAELSRRRWPGEPATLAAVAKRLGVPAPARGALSRADCIARCWCARSKPRTAAVAPQGAP